MSVTFKVRGERIDLDRPETFVNIANGNVRDLLGWLGLPAEEYGEERASEVAARCRRRLWPEARNADDGRAGSESGRVIVMERRPGYLNEKAQDMLSLCERAGTEGVITWG